LVVLVEPSQVLRFRIRICFQSWWGRKGFKLRYQRYKFGKLPISFVFQRFWLAKKFYRFLVGIAQYQPDWEAHFVFDTIRQVTKSPPQQFPKPAPCIW